ncbi:MAG: glutamyl-tRNA reductase [Gammaproteobacteria bacterium]
MDGISRLFSIGADFRMAPLAVREMISVSAENAAARLRQLTADCAREAAIVSTCNRTEVYCLTDRPGQVARWLAGASENALFRLRAKDAVRRAFCVASGIESQILGETEITGQVKQAAQIARDAGASGVFVNRLLEKSLAAAKEVRASTGIGRHSVSYCGLVARAAAGIFPDFSRLAVLFVGTGDMTRAGMPVFSGRGVRRIAVASRAPERAEQLAAPAGGEAIPLFRVPEMLAEFDVVVSATASPLPIIGKGAAEHALSARRRPMMFADLGVPRDLEPEIARLSGAFVYTLEQLGAQAEKSQTARREAATAAETIIARHVDDFCLWWEKRGAPEIRALRQDAETVRRRESEYALAKLRRGEDAGEVLDEFSRRLTAKILHQRAPDGEGEER